MKDIGKTLKALRENAGLTCREVAGKLIDYGFEISDKTIYGYDSGRSSANADMFLALCRVYKCNDILNTFGDISDSILFTNKEWELVESYRDLDPPGQSHVDSVLQWETERVQQIEQAASTVVEVADSDSQGRVLQYFHSVSAGAGEVLFDDVYTERITVPNKPQYHRVAYAVKVSGHSMEPLYHDKDILLVEPTCEISVGEIGIFNVNGQAYVKKLGKGKLISLNKGYDDIPLTEESLCMGRVVDSLKS